MISQKSEILAQVIHPAIEHMRAEGPFTDFSTPD